MRGEIVDEGGTLTESSGADAAGPSIKTVISGVCLGHVGVS